MVTPALDAPTAAALRADLAGWTVDAVSERLGERATRALGREQVMPAVVAARDAGSDRIAVLSRLLMLGDPVSRAQVDAALPRVGAAGLERAGLVRTQGNDSADAVAAVADMRPYAATTEAGQVDWWVASDLGEAVTGRAVGEDHVLGVGGASTTLASITMRSPRGRVLDLGTGCGIQALHASLHADEVVATDVSRRALGFARFNEALNAPALGRPSPRDDASETAAAEREARAHRPSAAHAPWDLREGSLLEPIAGEQFDQVVTNPPFVITPPGAPAFEYRDGGLQRDGVMERLLSGLGDVLAPGGVAQLLGNWEMHGDWRSRLEEWLDASNVAVDAWVVQRDVLDPAEYAETWLRDAGITPERHPATFWAAYEAYLRAFDAVGADAVGFGIVTLRRPASGVPTLRRLEEHEGALAAPLGPTLAAALEAHDWLVDTSDHALFDTALTVAPDVTKETYGRPLQVEPEHILLRQGGGFGRSIKADTALAGLVGACDGELTVGQIAHALAALLDVPSSRMLSGLVPAVRDLVRDGFLVH
ncbi:50S ribosomal protein L11 methyltransferase [Demequina sp. NBRC 110053]|uniref:DUF7059 domain-containing protein n=1 Tax=Demequina sp. NBRC 110053 TaxID=1570342 RepID=UPI0009FBA2E4|nr:50S ribosomal protein L11 methyltransferase [Demequina sp. NBRC 110053]